MSGLKTSFRKDAVRPVALNSLVPSHFPSVRVPRDRRHRSVTGPRNSRIGVIAASDRVVRTDGVRARVCVAPAGGASGYSPAGARRTEGFRG